MARIYKEVEVEFDLEDFELDELLEEIESRYESRDKKEIEKYRSSVTIKKRVKNGIQAHILN